MRITPWRLLRPIVDFALPPRCSGCGEPVAEDHRFCATCWTTLRFITPPWCAACRTPFAYDRGPDARCAGCIAAPPHHAGVYAAVSYGDVAGRLAVRLKHGGRIALADTMASLMARHLPRDADLLVPVPLHRWRLWRRGFNQAALIADALGRIGGIASDHRLLTRRHRTRLLRGLGRKERAREMKGVFGVDPGKRSQLQGRHVVLIDDVFTTGATAGGCVTTLRKAGAASVTVLCWARVLTDGAD